MNTLQGIFSPLYGMGGDILRNLSQLICHESMWHTWYFQGHVFNDEGHRQHFQKMHFPGRDTPISGLPSKTI